MDRKPPHIAVLPTPGMGHLLPLAELVRRLAFQHNFSITLITFSVLNGPAHQAFLSSLPSTVSSLSLPTIDLSDLPPSAKIETHMSVTSARAIPAITETLSDLQKAHGPDIIFIADIFSADTFDAAKQLGIPAYLFFPSNFLLLSLMLNLPELDSKLSCEFWELTEPVKLPGCVAIPGGDILTPLLDRKDEAYKWMVHHGNKYREADGILVNTFDAIEMGPAKVLKLPEPGRPTIYSVGPLIGPAREAGGAGCLDWLDNQPRGSVLFVSFGSGGTLSTEQTAELALGLEMSGVRFLWVVRSPSDHKPDAHYFNVESEVDSFDFLPRGFVGRTKGVGLIVSSWAPQVEVLAHEATGGFLTHCGWNSTLESIQNGVPMIAWPLYAEQRMNMVMLVEEVKAALKIEFGSDRIARKEKISEGVKELMEGENGKAVRYKVKELQEAATKALEPEGSSYMNLVQVANKWKGVS